MHSAGDPVHGSLASVLSKGGWRHCARPHPATALARPQIAVHPRHLTLALKWPESELGLLAAALLAISFRALSAVDGESQDLAAVLWRHALYSKAASCRISAASLPRFACLALVQHGTGDNAAAVASKITLSALAD